jgi:putative DNA primase/helicase
MIAQADLKELIKECAFIGDVDRSVALAAMLTVVLRGAFTVAPLFLFSKPAARTGGSYLVKIISTLALGRDAIPLNVSDDPKELVKELSAAAYEAQPILNLNNLNFDLKSSLLAQMITEGEVNIRPLGKNTETVKCDCRAMTVLTNGNNASLIGELIYRAMTSRLDTKMERPETKVYKGDPLAMIKRNRSKYLAGIFTIVRAFMNERPNVDVEHINGLEEWSRFVQAPLVWLGEADPAKSQEDAHARDPERGALRTRVLAVVKYFYHAARFTAAQVYAEAMRMVDGGSGRMVPAAPELLDAFVNADGRTLSAKSIGKWLSKDENRIVDGFSIEIARRSDQGSGNDYVVMPRPERANEPAEPSEASPEGEDEPF